MNYIKSLQLENQELKNRIIESQEIITELYRYLMLPKFAENNYVNKQDIFNRLEPARILLNTTI